jgi:hypothetical protein
MKNPQSFTTIGDSNTNGVHSRKRRIDTTTTTALYTNNEYLDDEASYAFFQPRTESSLSTPPLPSDPTDDKSSVVRRWLLFHLPKLKPQDVEVYTKVLMGDGFDSEEMLLEVREEDLDFMKVVSCCCCCCWICRVGH